MASIKIATGLKTYDIEDENGNVRGSISFNPSDLNLIARAQDVVTDIYNHINTLESKGSADNITEDEIKLLLTDTDTKVRSELNTLFADDDASDIIFGSQNCLSTYKGETFVERFITAFIPILKKDIEKEMELSQKRIEKYTSQVGK